MSKVKELYLKEKKEKVSKKSSKDRSELYQLQTEDIDKSPECLKNHNLSKE